MNILLRGSSLRFLLTRIIDIQKKSKNKILEIKNPEDFLKRLIFHKNINNQTMSFDNINYIIYTDGACLGNPGKGGWAAIIIEPTGEREIVGTKSLLQIIEWN